MAYEPRGKVADLIAAMRAPGAAPVWTSPEVAKAMDVAQGALTAHLDAAIRNGALYRQLASGKCQYSLKPFAAVAPAADPRAPQVVAGWVPPKMIATRPGSEQVARPTAPPPADPVPPAPVPPVATPAPASAEAVVESEGEQAEELEQEEVAEPDAYVSCRTGEIVLVGIEPDEDGRVTIPADLVRLVKAQIAWSPAR